ncbi:MAG TPA: extracellular solute-binding protein [Gaiellaceae bacterium]|jgi:multiple sugar transport system substrate-binding protein|nr:extracellular solute-binding protein [Gaiellaceae bacterium]
MKRVATAALLVAALTLAAGLIGSARSSASAAPRAKQAPVKLTLWVGWSARELNVFKKVVAEFDKARPNIDVKVVGGINDEKIIAAMRGGNAPDVVSSFTSSNVGNFCASGAWIDLGPYLQRAKIALSTFTPATLYYTQYKGNRCALPVLADTFGLYYNKKLFKDAGLTAPPKTFEQLTEYAKKLTKKNANGTIKVAGYNPVFGFYQNSAANYGPLWGAKWTNPKGASTLATSPGWSKLLRWQKSLVDWYGYKNLVKYNAGAGDEFAASHPFETGKMAMMMDGEWRVAFIEAEHPELDYATAPMPVDSAHPELYGAGYVNGTIIGIPKNGKNREQAWQLLRYLTTNTHALAVLSNGLRNVPSTRASLKSKELKPDPRFDTFLKVFAHPKSSTTPITAVGSAYQDLFTSFLAKYQAGRVGSMQSGLRNLDKQIDKQLKQAGGGVP